MSRAAMALAWIAVLAGCTKVERCKRSTVLLSLTLEGAAAMADELLISVSVDGGAAKENTVSRGARTSGTIEIAFKTYPAGKSLAIQVTARRSGAIVGVGTKEVTPAAGCDTASLTVTGVAGECANGALDTGETDIDCAGSCPPCADGKTCTVDGDCQSGVCNPTTMQCVASRCDNGVRDGAESDIDCGGGTCKGCAAGQACTAAGDCANNLCNTTKMSCVASTCDDGVVDGTETDVDCGGSCTVKCKQGQSCLSNSDCAPPSGCDGTRHCIAAQCTNGIRDVDNAAAMPPLAAESDVDCGGSVCAACAAGKSCSQASDCQNFCNLSTMKCVADACSDGVKGGSESDVDCGGSCSGKCAIGQGCNGPSDCGAAGAVCTAAHVCCAPNCAGKICGPDGCGFSCGTCSNSTTPMCNASGNACLCSGSSCASLGAGYTCGANGVCNPPGAEDCFDNFDNNSDGMIDCADPKCTSTAVCVPQLPAGFNAYGALTAHNACPGNTVINFYYTGVTSSTTCGGCGSCTASASCSFDIYSDLESPCSNTTNATTLRGTVSSPTGAPMGWGPCLQNPTIRPKITVSTPTWSGSCAPSGTPTLPAATPSYQDFCATTTVGGGCGAGKVCVPAGQTCVRGTGSCAGYASTTTLYSGLTDTRSCGGCTGCSVQTNGTCIRGTNAFVTFFPATDCTGGGSSFVDATVCTGQDGYYKSVRATVFSTIAPTCQGSPSSAVSGSIAVDPATAIKICCN